MWVRIIFPILLPFAIRWARGMEARILREGISLDEQGLRDAAAVGVADPDRIRVLLVDSVPGPLNPLLTYVGRLTGLLGGNTAGMSLRYGILIQSDCWPDAALVAHECTHTAQYERLGGIRAFLKKYLTECIELGYLNSPLELEAIDKARGLYQ